MTRNNFIDGELVVQNDAARYSDCPPDVYEFEFSTGLAHLCIPCAVTRSLSGQLWMGEIGPLIQDGVCEDCGNDDREILCA